MENKPRLEFLEDESFYEIPASCLESVHYENFWFAGRMISADQDAIASARVMGICLQTGYAAGTLAAYRLQHRLQSDSIAFIQSTWDD